MHAERPWLIQTNLVLHLISKLLETKLDIVLKILSEKLVMDYDNLGQTLKTKFKGQA